MGVKLTKEQQALVKETPYSSSEVKKLRQIVARIKVSRNEIRIESAFQLTVLCIGREKRHRAEQSRV